MAPPKALAVLAAAVLLSGPATVWADDLEKVSPLCNRDASATCRCLLACSVFGGHTGDCGGTEAQVLDVVDKAILGNSASEKDRCAGIKCVMQCSKQMNCIDDEITGRCLNVQQSLKKCDVTCNESLAHGIGAGAGLLLAALLGAATIGS
mmetsp:Transcript_115943/g.368724  ORF Transcript_115943/g.368724 Transcript_115943/m.368724 type:complete len:150 (-) Transcript_115943:275-724(-)|eukprot:CAMPEP_0177220486 /NCGR_PEP_ID=MMETSP0367-20130122/36912_1 /TAXON_ID=447022 ORGANISM="Scrippsiella hangoei-like, Strain SHHI-4" /NCGR_SAMPLE_ID=MMETSP0367 /ASSEMBLY_ACC=CAM_ASM_000362 /LENGTH=149 /DNA_ID=CAMNT_0018670263 /DNA_START=72 /DNA_END=521 /DNA_ORIENTATION=-